MNILELSDKFPTELHAVAFLERKRWGKIVRCTECNSREVGNRQKDMRYPCKECGNTFSVTTGTQIHNTRLPVKTWLFALSIITDAKKGKSALELQRNIGVSYKTAWIMYHKLRELMSTETNRVDELSDIVEMDETYIGGKPRRFNDPCFKPKQRKALDNKIDEMESKGFDFKPQKKSKAKCDDNPKRGRGTNNIPVVGIVERNGNVVAEVMKTLTFDNLKKMVKKYVDEDASVLITDSYSGYNSMKKIIDHIKVDHQRFYSYKGVNSNSIESFWAIIERGIMGQYHSVSPKHLPKYIAEFVYKYNNRNDNGAMFDELVLKLVSPN